MVAPGITLEELNSQIAQYGKQVPLIFPIKQSISIEDAIQGNMICMSSLKDGFFAD